jgi:hypothetical protein
VVKPEVFDLVHQANRLSGEKPIHIGQAKANNCPCPKCNPLANDEGGKQQDG